jgi:hypothetical protein
MRWKVDPKAEGEDFEDVTPVDNWRPPLQGNHWRDLHGKQTEERERRNRESWGQYE